MAISVAIMAVPQRLDTFVSEMETRLPAQVCLAVDKLGEGVLPTAYRAWRSYNQEATHHLVLQDDLILPPNFMSLVFHVMERNPEHILTFHAFSVKLQRFFNEGYRWIICKQISGQANLYPIPILERLLEFCETKLRSDMPLKPSGKKRMSDDGVVNMFLRVEKLRAYMPLPNFVQHAAPTDSVLGQNNEGKVTPCYIGDYPGEEFDWTFNVNKRYPTAYPYKRKERWDWDYYLGPSPF